MLPWYTALALLIVLTAIALWQLRAVRRCVTASTTLRVAAALNPFGLRAAGLLPGDPTRNAIYGDRVFAPCIGVVRAENGKYFVRNDRIASRRAAIP